MNDEIEDKEALYTVIPTTLYKKELKKYLKQPKKIDKILDEYKNKEIEHTMPHLKSMRHC